MTVVKVVELVGNSPKSWEDAANNALEEAAKTVRNIGGMHVINMTAIVKDGEISEYRSNVKISFAVEAVRG